MEVFSNIFHELSGYKSIAECIDKKITPVSVTGLSHIHRAHMISALESGGVNLVITGSEAEAKQLCDDINMMTEKESAVLFPSREQIFMPVDSANHEYEYMRIAALARAVRNKCRVICAAAEAVMQPVIPPDVLISASLEINSDMTIDRDDLCQHLVKLGYQRCEKVDGASQFSVRGSIVDVFPVQAENPVRIELWGDQIDTMAEFDVSTQRRTDISAEYIEIPPASEIICGNDELADKLESLLKRVRGKYTESVRANLGADVKRLRAGEILPHGMKYYSIVY
ncbi:MAG: transcription-repair coupling factor, partial [Ruminococcus sp.]|nr:transcription-repair coupling factor [Ruminococcus sp.]